MKKFIILLFVFLALAATLMGCNVNNGGNNNKTSPTLTQNQQSGGTGIGGAQSEPRWDDVKGGSAGVS